MRVGAKQWLEIAQSDYEVSRLLFKHAHQRPQKVHDLKAIAGETGLTFSQEQYQMLKDLTRHYKKVRYPDFARFEYNTKTKVEPIIKQGQKLYLWILARFKNH